MPNAHDVALLTMTAGTAVGALLMADAAEEARGRAPKRRTRDRPRRRVPKPAEPLALHCAGLVFLGGMTISGALLVGALP